MAIGTFVRWGARHGLAARIVRSAARSGDDMHARIATDRSLRADPYPFYDEIRAKGTVVPGRLAMITAHHAVASAILRDENWRTGVPQGMAPPWLVRTVTRFQDEEVVGALEPPSLLSINGADHARLRRLVSRAFTPRAVDRLHGRVSEIATELLDALERGNRNDPVDLVQAYAAALPALVIADVLGVPRALHPTFLRWGHAIAPTLDIGLAYGPYRRSEEATRELNRWLRGHFEVLRREPGDGILGGIVALTERSAPEDAAGESGEPPLTQLELTSISGLLLAAGFETTVNLLGNGVVALLAHPEQLEVLRADPALWRNAVEEILRYDSPVQFVGRHPDADTEVAGVLVPRGRIVAMVLGGINRDPAVFADPHRLDVTRANAREHLAFSGGAHFCLGAALARLEGEVGLRLLFERFPDLQVAGLPRRRPTRVLRGYEHLPVALRAPVRTTGKTLA
jgi:cytochrome P450